MKKMTVSKEIQKSYNPKNPNADNKQGWEIKKLGEVADVGAGNSAPQDKELFENGKFPFFRTSDVGQIRKGFIETSVDYLNEKGIKGLKLFQKGTILFPKSGASTFLNHRVMMNVDGYVSSHLATIKAKSKIADDRFLLYFLITIDAKDLMQDIAYPSLKTSDIGLIPIPLPPLPEQQRIVSILDECFAAIDKAKANAEQNLKNAKELFESYLQGVFEKKGEGWEEKRFDEVCVLQRGFDLPTHSRFEGEYPLVSSNGITDSVNQWKVKAPGVVTGRSGTIGNVHFIEEDFWPLNTALYIKDFHGNDERFIYYFLTAFDLSKYSSGAGVPTLNRNNVHIVKVSIPKSKEAQQTIVRRLDALRAETQKLEAVYQKKIADLEELKKSILQKAFSGELC